MSCVCAKYCYSGRVSKTTPVPDSVNDADIRSALDSRRGDWPQIAELSKVSHSWISKFVRKQIPNPGIETLRLIQAALARPAKSDSAASRSKARV